MLSNYINQNKSHVSFDPPDVDLKSVYDYDRVYNIAHACKKDISSFLFYP